MRERVGIFGGTFSPPHVGHVQAASFFLSEIRLDRLIVMPANIPPHKRMLTGDDPLYRLRLSKAAFEGLSDRVTVSDYEIRKAGVSYTAETLQAFSGPDVKLYFLVGTDMFLSMDTWYRPEEIFRLSTVVCALRSGSPEDEEKVKEKAKEYRKRFGARIRILKGRPLEISSTEIRERRKNDHSGQSYRL